MKFTDLNANNMDIGFQIQSEAFGKEFDGYARKWFPHIIQRSDYTLALAEYEGQPVGLIGAMTDVVSPATYALGWVSVKPEFQGQGLGKKMIDGFAEHLIERHKLKGCSFILSAEKETHELYKKLGFELQGTLHDGSSLMMKVVK